MKKKMNNINLNTIDKINEINTIYNKIKKFNKSNNTIVKNDLSFFFTINNTNGTIITSNTAQQKSA